MGQPPAQGQQQGRRLLLERVAVGSTMKGSASLAPSADTSMNVRVAEVPMDCQDVSRRERVELEKLTQRGRTPVKVEKMLPYLRAYPDRAAAVLLEDGFRDGFQIPCSALENLPVCGNLKSVLLRPEVVTSKLATEVALGRMAGPFKDLPIPALRVSPLGLVPKKEPNKFRLIHHLSYPAGASVNDGIDADLCKVVYTSFDAALHWVRRYGCGALLAKTDVEAAFRLLPVHPNSFCLLGCTWQDHFYVDCCLPMGCSVSCYFFELFSTFVEWVVIQEALVSSVLHYLDDFLFIGPPGSRVCAMLLRTMERVAVSFGIPLAPDKTEGPATEIRFLGIVIDSLKMECRLPEDKVLDLKLIVGAARRAKKLKLRELQSLLGKLNFACRVIPMGRVFCRRLSMATAGVSRPYHFVRLSSALRADLEVWSAFLEHFNGRSLFLEGPMSNTDLELFTDASGAHGFGAFFQGEWCAEEWPAAWREAGLCGNLALLELFPIVVALEIWGERLSNKRVRFMCDNLGVVQAVNRQTANSPPVVSLLRHFVLKCLLINSHCTAVHVPGVDNNIADSLSRFQWDRFRALVPEAADGGISCPAHLWRLV